VLSHVHLSPLELLTRSIFVAYDVSNVTSEVSCDTYTDHLRVETYIGITVQTSVVETKTGDFKFNYLKLCVAKGLGKKI
jgi:hypothetical protein